MHHQVCHYRSRSRMLYFGLLILAGTLTMPAGAQEQG
ncbi:MAG: hypothetical protein H6R26_3464, partial [Proteobacteria bacterium]|nr:hypothetical protein [Pseudomonadota bacterium]